MLLLQTKVTKIFETTERPPSTTFKQIAIDICCFKLQRFNNRIQIKRGVNLL